jgi:hypothetical protein
MEAKTRENTTIPPLLLYYHPPLLPSPAITGPHYYNSPAHDMIAVQSFIKVSLSPRVSTSKVANAVLRIMKALSIVLSLAVTFAGAKAQTPCLDNCGNAYTTCVDNIPCKSTLFTADVGTANTATGATDAAACYTVWTTCWNTCIQEASGSPVPSASASTSEPSAVAYN